MVNSGFVRLVIEKLENHLYVIRSKNSDNCLGQLSKGLFVEIDSEKLESDTIGAITDALAEMEIKFLSEVESIEKILQEIEDGRANT